MVEKHADRRPPVPGPARELLRGIVDYAGLFPPAGLTMPSAVEDYASNLRGADAWALGRFIAPATRLPELDSAIAVLNRADDRTGWRVSALLGTDSLADLERVRAFNEESEAARRRIAVDTLELKGTSEEQIRRALEQIPSGFERYVELSLESGMLEEAGPGLQGKSGGAADAPSDPSMGGLLQLIRDAGARAKVRTGGVRAEMFPRPRVLLRFLRACTEVGVPFKATAGLHHPVNGIYPLTYDADSGSAAMYGYLNLLLATALVRQNAPDGLVLEALQEKDATAFHLDEQCVAWREHRFDSEEVQRLRERSLVAFGSCSFREPMDGLTTVAASSSRKGVPAP